MSIRIGLLGLLLFLVACSGTSNSGNTVGDNDEENVIACFSDENCPDDMTCDLEKNICQVSAGDPDVDEPVENDLEPPETDEEEIQEMDEEEFEPDQDEIDVIEEEEDLPVASIVFLQPEEGEMVDQSVSLKVEIQNMNVADVAFRIGDRELTILQQEPWEFQWDTSGEAEGEIVVKAFARDSSLEVIEAEREFVIDHNAPSLTITEPNPQDPAKEYHFGERVEVKLAVEEGSRLDHVEVVLDFENLDSMDVNSDELQPMLDLFGVDELSPGAHSVTLTGVDALGRKDAEPDQLQFTIDSSAPEVRISGFDSSSQGGSACVEDSNCPEGQRCATLDEYCGNGISGGYCLPSLSVDQAFSIDIVDPSGVEVFDLSTYRAGSTTVLAGTNTADELPLEIEHFDDILVGEKYYPLYLEIQVIGEDDEHGPKDLLGNTGDPFCRVVAVDRLKWRYDSGISPLPSFENYQAPAASNSGHLYAPLYDTLTALDTGGTPLWSCEGEGGITAGPMVSEGDENQPTAIVWGDEDGKAWIRLDQTDATCIASEVVETRAKLVGSPVLISRENLGNGFTLKMAYATIRSSGFDIYLGTYSYDANQPELNGWTMEKKFSSTGILSSVSMAYDASRNRLWFSNNTTLYRLIPETGGVAGQSVFSSTSDSRFRGGFGVDSEEGIVYFSTINRLQLYQTNFERFTPFPMNSHIMNTAQPIPVAAEGEAPRKIYFSGTEVSTAGTAPYLMAHASSQYSVPGPDSPGTFPCSYSRRSHWNACPIRRKPLVRRYGIDASWSDPCYRCSSRRHLHGSGPLALQDGRRSYDAGTCPGTGTAGSMGRPDRCKYRYESLQPDRGLHRSQHFDGVATAPGKCRPNRAFQRFLNSSGKATLL